MMNDSTGYTAIMGCSSGQNRGLHRVGPRPGRVVRKNPRVPSVRRHPQRAPPLRLSHSRCIPRVYLGDEREEGTTSEEAHPAWLP